MKNYLKVIFVSILLGVSCVAFADLQSSNQVNLGSRIATTEEIVEFFAKPEAQSSIRTRGGVKLLNDEKSVIAPKSISLQIQFAFNSFDLTLSSIDQLKPFGLALASQALASLQFDIEGHTDAVGSEGYNMNLSEQRAATVKQYFMQHYGIVSSRISVIAKGESELLNPQQPNSGTNRRVNIVAIY